MRWDQDGGGWERVRVVVWVLFGIRGKDKAKDGVRVTTVVKDWCPELPRARHEGSLVSFELRYFPVHRTLCVSDLPSIGK